MLGRSIVGIVAIGVALAVISPAHAQAPASAPTPTVPLSRTVSLGDAAFPNDTTYSFYNSYTSAKTPTGNHLDLAKVTATYDKATKRLMVDWVMWTPITKSNCPAFPLGAQCEVNLLLWPVSPTGELDLVDGAVIELTGVPFAALAAQNVRNCFDGDCDNHQAPAVRTQTFGHHYVVWFNFKNWTQVRVRPGSETTAGTFTSGGAARVNDPYWIDSKHQMAVLIDWTGGQRVPDLLIG